MHRPAGAPIHNFAQQNPAYTHARQPQVAPTPVQQAPAPAAATTPSKGKDDKPDGCIKKSSKAYKKFSLSACGASIIALIKIVLATTTIVSVWAAFAGAFRVVWP